MEKKEYRKITELREWDKNPRSIKTNDFERLKKQITKLGQYKPILITADGEVIGGNMRLKAYRELGVEDIWVSVVNPKDENEKLEYALSDNDRAGFYDSDLIANLMPDYPEFNWGDYAVDLKEPQTLDDLIQSLQPIEEDEVPEVSDEPAISKLGEVYQLGRHRLMCGDSTKIEDVEKLMDGEKIKTVFTSPPYNMGGSMYKNYSDDLKSDEYIKFNLQVINNIVPFLRGYMFWNISYNKNSRWEFIEILYKIVKETGLKFLEMIVWDKGHAIPITAEGQLTRQYEDILMVADEDTIKKEMELYFLGTTEKQAYFNKKINRGITNYWKVDTNKIQNDINKACFPVNLPAKGIRLTSDEGDIVFDPFLGSGTTLIASEQLNRSCYGIELDPALCDVIRKRYAKFIGKEDEWQTITPQA